MRSVVSAGNESDYKQASALTKDYQPMVTLADKGYDADWLVAELMRAGVSEMATPPKKKPKATADV